MTKSTADSLEKLPPVLLTSCVYIVDQGVNLKKPEERIKHTLESIERWFAIEPNIELVICDSSNFDFSELALQNFPNKKIECLHFQADSEMVSIHGKGYGEGEIIKFALAHSSVLKNHEYFAKCTAKLWVENFHACIAEWNGSFLCRGAFDNVFSLKPTVFDHIDTRFYLVSKKFYFQFLINAHHDVGGSSGKSIEDIFKEVLMKNMIQRFIFRSPPIVGGVGGGTGKYYNTRTTKQLKEFLRYRVLYTTSSFRQLFNS
jgi:hypothetical protein